VSSPFTSVSSKTRVVSTSTKADDKNFDGIDAWMSEQGFSDDDYHYFMEDGVIVKLMIVDDELEPM
jgi:hypothetical protein